MPNTLYLFLLTFEAIFVFFLAIYLGLLVFSSIMGAPYVPTKRKVIEEILKMAKLKRGQKFLELGCGDGRVSLIAATKFGVKAHGIDINPLVIYKARIRNKLLDAGASFAIENIFKTELKKFDVIYIFLMPEFIRKLSPRLLKQTKKGVLIISHGFKVKALRRKLIKTLPSYSFPTYYYKI